MKIPRSLLLSLLSAFLLPACDTVSVRAGAGGAVVDYTTGKAPVLTLPGGGEVTLDKSRPAREQMLEAMRAALLWGVQVAATK